MVVDVGVGVEVGLSSTALFKRVKYEGIDSSPASYCGGGDGVRGCGDVGVGFEGGVVMYGWWEVCGGGGDMVRGCGRCWVTGCSRCVVM